MLSSQYVPLMQWAQAAQRTQIHSKSCTEGKRTTMLKWVEACSKTTSSACRWSLFWLAAQLNTSCDATFLNLTSLQEINYGQRAPIYIYMKMHGHIIFSIFCNFWNGLSNDWSIIKYKIRHKNCSIYCGTVESAIMQAITTVWQQIVVQYGNLLSDNVVEVNELKYDKEGLSTKRQTKYNVSSLG